MFGLELDSNLKLSLVEKENPPLKRNEVMIHVTSCGICGTDNHIIKGESRVTLPVILGHEFGGVVEDAGSEVQTLQRGDLVVVDPNIPCRTCEYCRSGEIHLCKNLTAIGVDVDGGMSDTCIVSQEQAYKLSPAFDPVDIPFVEPLSCVLHGLDRIDVKHGERVLVVGAGTIGMMFIMLLKDVAGKIYVDELISSRLMKAIALGAASVASDKAEYFDVVIECSGTIDGFDKALHDVKRGGRILLFGVAPKNLHATISPNEIYNKEITILGSYVNPHTFARAIDLIANKKISISTLNMKVFSLKNYKEAFDASRGGEYSKVAFNFSNGSLRERTIVEP